MHLKGRVKEGKRDINLLDDVRVGSDGQRWAIQKTRTNPSLPSGCWGLKE